MEETVLTGLVIALGVVLLLTVVIMPLVYRRVRRIERGAVALWELGKEATDASAETPADNVTAAESEPGQGG